MKSNLRFWDTSTHADHQCPGFENMRPGVAALELNVVAETVLDRTTRALQVVLLLLTNLSRSKATQNPGLAVKLNQEISFHLFCHWNVPTE
jgi:hypothetical protein